MPDSVLSLAFAAHPSPPCSNLAPKARPLKSNVRKCVGVQNTIQKRFGNNFCLAKLSVCCSCACAIERLFRRLRQQNCEIERIQPRINANTANEFLGKAYLAMSKPNASFCSGHSCLFALFAAKCPQLYPGLCVLVLELCSKPSMLVSGKYSAGRLASPKKSKEQGLEKGQVSPGHMASCQDWVSSFQITRD